MSRTVIEPGSPSPRPASPRNTHTRPDIPAGYSGDTISVLTEWAIYCSLRAWRDWHGWSSLVCRIM